MKRKVFSLKQNKIRIGNNNEKRTLIPRISEQSEPKLRPYLPRMLFIVRTWSSTKKIKQNRNNNDELKSYFTHQQYCTSADTVIEHLHSRHTINKYIARDPVTYHNEITFKSFTHILFFDMLNLLHVFNTFFFYFLNLITWRRRKFPRNSKQMTLTSV